jgi:hypothetical protein
MKWITEITVGANREAASGVRVGKPLALSLEKNDS